MADGLAAMECALCIDTVRRLIRTSTLNSDCLEEVRLEVTVKGSQVTLAGQR